MKRAKSVEPLQTWVLRGKFKRLWDKWTDTGLDKAWKCLTCHRFNRERVIICQHCGSLKGWEYE